MKSIKLAGTHLNYRQAPRGYAERIIRTIMEEEIGLSEYRDFQEAYDQIGRFIDDVYAHKRIHSSVGYLRPAEFEQQWRATH